MAREAAIVATARTPIGRAGKGSLKDMRPDDLSAIAIEAVEGATIATAGATYAALIEKLDAQLR